MSTAKWRLFRLGLNVLTIWQDTRILATNDMLGWLIAIKIGMISAESYATDQTDFFSQQSSHERLSFKTLIKHGAT